MAKCTGLRCPMQVGYKVDECDYKDCRYRTEPITNAQKIRAMSDEELAEFIYRCEMGEIDYAKTFCDLCNGQYKCGQCRLDWLQQPAE